MNLLLNSDFEGAFLPWRNSADLFLAAGWSPWWVEQTGKDPAWKNRRPEFKCAPLDADPGRVRTGASAQQYYSFWGTHVAGLWQQVVVPPGAYLRFQIWGQAWSSEADKPRPSQNPTHAHMSVGIDPLGGADPFGRSIVWSVPENAIDEWRMFSVEAQAHTDVITVFVRSAPEWPKKHQNIYWDEATLEIIEDGPDDVLSSGGDLATRFEFLPPALRVGMEAQVRVLTAAAMAREYASVLVRRGGQYLPPPELQTSRQGDEHVWEFAFTPAQAEPHHVIFGTDAGSRVISWATVKVREAKETPDEPDATPAVQAEPEGLPQSERTAGGSELRLRYGRTYVLLPPTADSVWAEAAMRGSFDARRTVGFSADDAGIGDLAHKVVIAVNPHHWLYELTADWFEEHYPGVRFHALIVDTPEELVKSLRSWRE